MKKRFWATLLMVGVTLVVTTPNPARAAITKAVSMMGIGGPDTWCDFCYDNAFCNNAEGIYCGSDGYCEEFGHDGECGGPICPPQRTYSAVCDGGNCEPAGFHLVPTSLISGGHIFDGTPTYNGAFNTIEYDVGGHLVRLYTVTYTASLFDCVAERWGTGQITESGVEYSLISSTWVPD